ncbi:discoidin domain-containing protein [Aestuariivivens sp. NBU2969]|uniref:discoidin domain-containing protein n=1 Tax=Aestuariivivens sp. NBU2969 TaxID=2873267 RepID=UPI001CBBCD4A|nr:discoidin domain-containing protein [Aestuariivivens sp. NBU2969]
MLIKEIPNGLLKIVLVSFLAFSVLACDTLNVVKERGNEFKGYEIFVNIEGDDTADGLSPETALKTIEGARNLIRRNGLNKNMKADICVYIAPGRYQLDKTLRFDAEDSGSNGYNVVYRNLEDEKPVMCGGRTVKNWEKVTGTDYYVADVSEDLGYAGYFKQLYVNGIRAQQAISNKPFRAISAPKFGDIQKGDVRSAISKHPTRHWWNDPETEQELDGIEFSKQDLHKSYSNVNDLSIHALLVFKMLQIPVEEIMETDSSYIFRLSNSDFQWWTTWQDASGAMGHFIVNAIEELDEPGEWCLNTTEDKIYYMPHSWENINEADVYVPVLERLVDFRGTYAARIKNIVFDGLVFQHGNWLYPEKHLLGRSQAEITGRYDSEVPGQIILNYADDVQIKNSVFRHLGSCGIQPYEGTMRIRIEGNYFYDLSAAAVSTGKWYTDKLLCPDSTICKHTLIRNNVVRNIGRDYYQASAINTFAAYDVIIENNDISDIAYAGIHARIGDKPTHHTGIGRLTYRRNLLSRSSSMHKWGIRDGGTLYTHGYYPNCLVEENYVVYTSQNVMDVYYADNWSNDSRWQNNVSKDSHAEHVCRAWMSSSDRVIFDNNYGDAPCPSAGGAQLINYHYIENEQWPDSAISIMNNAGLEKDYQDMATHAYGHESLLKNKPVIVSSEKDENIAEYGNDNNWETYWHTASGTNGNAWYQVDMEDAYVLEKLVIIPVKDRFESTSRSNYEVQASNDSSFKDYTVLAAKNEVVAYYKTDTKCSNMWEVFLNEPQPFRYLRIVAKNKTASFSFAEFEAFGYKKVAE